MVVWPRLCALAIAIQLVPLAGPLLLSQDAYAYWDYGRLATRHDAEPVRGGTARASRPTRRHKRWRPHGGRRRGLRPGVHRRLGQPRAGESGGSGETAAFAYRLAAATGMLALVAIAALVAPFPAFGVAFVGWNPLPRNRLRGRRSHDDVWMMVLVLGALALATRHPRLSGARAGRSQRV
mgnify:CR=1 FL=1